MEAHQVHGFNYFDQVVKLWVCDGVVVLMEAHQVHGFTYFDQVVKLWVYDGVVVLMEAHQVHGFTYFDQVVKLWVYDGVVVLMEAHELRGCTHNLVTTVAANQERLWTLGPEICFAQTLLRESLLESVYLEVRETNDETITSFFGFGLVCPCSSLVWHNKFEVIHPRQIVSNKS